MDDDDEWQLSAEQLDALERDAKTQLAQRQRFPFSNTVSSALPLPSSSSSSSYSTMDLSQSSASSFFVRPFSSASSASDQLHSSPLKRCSVAAPQNSPYKPASFTSDFLQRSPLKRSSAVAFQVASPLRSSESPGKVFADRGGAMTSPLKNSDKAVPFKVFLDRPGLVAVETYYNQQLVAAFKSIRGHEWDHKRKLWVFPEHHFEDICKAAALCLPVHMEIDVVPPLSIPPDFLKLCKSSAMNITSPLDPSKSESCEPSSSQQSEENNTQDVANPFKPKRSLFFVVQVFLKDDDHIATRSPYHENIKRACQSVAGRSWNPVEKIWTFPRNNLENLVQALANISSPEVKVEAVPPLVISPPILHRDFVESCASPVAGSQVLLDPMCEARAHELRQNDLLNMPNDLGKDVAVKKHVVKLILHTSGKLAAKCDYDPQLVMTMRSISGAEWWSKERLWKFPLSCLCEIEQALSSVPNVQVEHLEPLVQRALSELNTLPKLEGQYDSIPKDLEAQLLPFQRTGVRFALLHGGRALIADEMGLGKTLQAIGIATCFQEDWPVLVIVPSALRIHWAVMLKKWLNIRPMDITVLMSQGLGSNRDGFNVVLSSGKTLVKLDGVFNIISYDIVPKLQQEFADMNFKVVIADESHYMKNGQAKRTIACVPLIQKAKYAVLLTGTPALSRPMELFKQLQALQPSVYQNVHEYGKRYCTGGVFGMYQGASNHEELHALLKSTIMIRRLKREVLSELPQKRRQQVFLSLDKDGVKQMRALFLELEDVRRRSCNCNEAEMAEKLKYAEKQLISKIYTESGKVKLPVVQEYLTTILETDCKFLVFAHHQQMLDGIQSLLVKKKVGYIRIDGATPAISRHTLATKFQDDQKIQVALLGIRAAGVGLTLTAASTVVFAEMSWTPGDLVQAEDRAHRIGQESAVNVHYLHAHDTVDDLIWDSVQNKLENLGQVLDGKEDNLNASAAPLQSQALLHRQGTLDTFLFSKRFSNSRSDPFHNQESAFCNIKSMPAKEAEHPSESARTTEADNDIDEEHLNVPKALTQNYLPESSTENVSAKRSKFS